MDLEKEVFTGFMLAHFSAGQVLDLVAEFVVRAGGVILVPGVPTLMADADQFGHLPEEIRDGAKVIRTGADITAAISATD